MTYLGSDGVVPSPPTVAPPHTTVIYGGLSVRLNGDELDSRRNRVVVLLFVLLERWSVYAVRNPLTIKDLSVKTPPVISPSDPPGLDETTGSFLSQSPH